MRDDSVTLPTIQEVLLLKATKKCSQQKKRPFTHLVIILFDNANNLVVFCVDKRNLWFTQVHPFWQCQNTINLNKGMLGGFKNFCLRV